MLKGYLSKAPRKLGPQMGPPPGFSISWGKCVIRLWDSNTHLRLKKVGEVTLDSNEFSFTTLIYILWANKQELCRFTYFSSTYSHLKYTTLAITQTYANCPAQHHKYKYKHAFVLGKPIQSEFLSTGLPQHSAPNLHVHHWYSYSQSHRPGWELTQVARVSTTFHSVPFLSKNEQIISQSCQHLPTTGKLQPEQMVHYLSPLQVGPWANNSRDRGGLRLDSHCGRLTRQVRWGLAPTKETSFPLWALELEWGNRNVVWLFADFSNSAINHQGGGDTVLLAWIFLVQRKIG